jgi:hypothetical protein
VELCLHSGPPVGTSKASSCPERHISKDGILVSLLCKNPLAVFNFTVYKFPSFIFLTLGLAKINCRKLQTSVAKTRHKKREIKNLLAWGGGKIQTMLHLFNHMP